MSADGPGSRSKVPVASLSAVAALLAALLASWGLVAIHPVLALLPATALAVLAVHALSRLKHRQEQMEDRVQVQLDRLADQLDSAFAAVRSELLSSQETQSGRILELGEQMEEIAQLGSQVSSLSSAVERERIAWREAVSRERSHRICSFAQRDGRQSDPQRWLLLVTVPRTGSTWLFDALRSHPAVGMEPAATLFRRLLLRGGRYPQALTTTGEGQDLEISVGQGAKVPAPPGRPDAVAHYVPWAIEKLHPDFFDHDVERLVAELAQLEAEGKEVRFIYQFREPLETLQSFVNYKKRDPAWLPNLAEGEVPVYLARSYETLLKMARRRPGRLVEYHHFRDRPVEVVAAIFRDLWPEGDAGDLLASAKWSKEVTDLERRRKEQPSPFYGMTRGVNGEAESWNLDAIRRCQSAYEALSELASADSAVGDGRRIDAV